MKLSNIFNYRHPLTMLILALGAWSLLLTADSRVHASLCMDIADIPLDAMTQTAPGMIMFVIDDSGSMDWSMMCPPPESSGVFNGFEYVFSNPGDDAYTSGSNDDNLEDSSSDRMMWMSQWAGYNGLYYDPETEYTPWPTQPDANIDNPRSNPMIDGNRLDMTALWHEWDGDAGLIVDNSDADGFVKSAGWGDGSGGQYNNYHYSNGSETTVTATWTSNNLDPSTTYTVYARWLIWEASRLTDVHYSTYDDTTPVADTGVNQRENHNEWMPIATDVTFSTGIGVVTIFEHDGGSSKVCADAVKFVPLDNPVSDIARRHYFVRNDTGTYLVNLLGGNIEYYRVNLVDPNDNREFVTAGQLVRLTAGDASTAGIVTGRTYTEECQNFANWYSFYRRRELTAKNAIANVISTMDGVYIGLIYINDYRGLDQRALPVRVNLDGVFEDESAALLDILYGYDIAGYSTPLRNGLKKAGSFYQGIYMKPVTFSDQTSSSTYPFFKADKGGSCQQAFTIIFSDGYYNGSAPGVGNTDGDNNTDFDGDPFGDTASDTLADVAMRYFEIDLNATLDDDVSITTVDPAGHQHMVTYTLAFGVTGSLDIELYKDCPIGACPESWPDPTSSDSGKIDDMFHAAINGRGSYLSAGSTTELNAALMALGKDIESRMGASSAVATNSVQRTAGSMIYQGVYNTNNWYGEVRAMPLNVVTGVVGDPIWVASDHLPEWDSRNILSSNGSAGFVFEAGNLSASQVTLLEASGLGTAEQLVNFIRGDTSNSVANDGSLRDRNHLLGDIVHSSPTLFNGHVYIGANDGMLHAFDAVTGEERFAYVPNLVYGHLADLADTGYSHRYYVDNSATVTYVDGQHVLVGGLRKGGKGYFALDVTDPTAMDGSKFLWEYPPAADDDMGYSYSRASIVRTKAEGYVVIFGNGYDSVNGNAVLYVLNAVTGTLIKKLDTGVGGCNGLATPAVVDVQADGMADYAFAGDLKGNMWKFDLRGDSTDDWMIYYQDGGTPMPLVTVKNASGEIQPITSASEVKLDCADMKEGRGVMVYFGTGQYLNNLDFADTTVQSIYGIWDWGGVWEATDDIGVARTKFLGIFNGDRSLSNTSAILMQQEFTDETDMWWVMTDNQPVWVNPVDNTGSHVGWYFDLPESDEGERMIQPPLLRLYSLVLLSSIPSSSPCSAGGRSTMYIVDPCSGGDTTHPEFDVNNDRKVTQLDIIVTGGGISQEPDAKKIPKMMYGPLEGGDRLYPADPDGGTPPDIPVVDNREGMFYWRVLGD